MTSYNLLPIFAMQSLSRTFVSESTSSSLYRDFISEKTLNSTIPAYRRGPDISFIRNSYATYFDSTGSLQLTSTNVPRFDYAPDGTFLGLLIEDQATNLIPYSDNFTTTSWTYNPNAVQLQADILNILAPNKTETSTLILPTTANDFHTITWGNTPFPFPGGPTTANTFNRSIFVKKEKARFLIISCSPTVSAFAAGQPNFDTVANIFDFDTESFIKFSVPSPAVQKINNGWYRISLSRASTNINASNLTIGVCNGPDFENAKFAGEEGNLSGVYVWGGQVELGLFSSSYIPTSGSQVTRAADNAFIGGKNFTTFYNLTAGTYITTVSQNNTFDSRAIATFTNTTGSKYLALGTTISGDKHAFFNTSGPTLTTGNVNADQFYTLGISYKNNDFVLSQNGNIIDQKIEGTVPVAPLGIVKYELGQFNNSKYFNGHVRQINYIPARVSNETLSDLTINYDTDAFSYLNQVQLFDGQNLEPTYKIAINSFVELLKSDSIWSQVTGMGILAGARTLSGALVPLKGPAPTSFNFVLSDYTRFGGLSGDGQSKYIDTKIPFQSRPFGNSHYSVYMSKKVEKGVTSNGAIIATSITTLSSQDFMRVTFNPTTSAASSDITAVIQNRVGLGLVQTLINANSPGFKGASRSSTNVAIFRANNTTFNVNRNISTPASNYNTFLYAGNSLVAGFPLGIPTDFNDVGLTFYSVGSGTNLELLESRVETLMQTISTLT